jgi:hypothetical protein
MYHSCMENWLDAGFNFIPYIYHGVKDLYWDLLPVSAYYSGICFSWLIMLGENYVDSKEIGQVRSIYNVYYPYHNY